MEQLQFSAVHEDGQHLVLSTPDGTEFLLPVDERLRSALRNRGPAADLPAAQLSPRDVQAMIRAGQTAAEVAELTGWPVDRVSRFEVPIIAEREHVAGLARAAHVRGRAADGVVPTLETRVMERLVARGVDPDNTSWDATRPAGGSWTVIVSFVAGQRQRAAAWRFEPADRAVEALDDEARWLSEDEQALPGSAAGKQLLGTHGASEEVDLVTSMRERSRTRSRRKKPATAREGQAPPAQAEQDPGSGVGSDPSATGPAAEDVLPLEPAESTDTTSTETPTSADTSGSASSDAPTSADTLTSTDSPKSAPTDAPADSAAAGSEAADASTTTDSSATIDSSQSGRGSRRGRSGRGKSGRSRSGRATREAGAPAQTADPSQDAAQSDATAESTATKAPTSFAVELDFDEDYEVDPTPQEATLTDLFGPGDPLADEVPVDDYLEDEDFDDAGLDDGPDVALDDIPQDHGAPADTAAATPPAGIQDLAFDNDETDDAASSSGNHEADHADSSGNHEGTAADSAAPNGPSRPATEADESDDSATAAPKDPAAQEPGQRGAKRRKDGRPGVPSWDDIMFGAKDRD